MVQYYSCLTLRSPCNMGHWERRCDSNRYMSSLQLWPTTCTASAKRTVILLPSSLPEFVHGESKKLFPSMCLILKIHLKAKKDIQEEVLTSNSTYKGVLRIQRVPPPNTKLPWIKKQHILPGLVGMMNR